MTEPRGRAARRDRDALEALIQAVADAGTVDFRRLVEIARLDPADDLRFADWAGVDFRGCDLRGFDFTGANLTGCRFDGALIEGARFETAQVERAALRAAVDWDDYVGKWQPPSPTPGLGHLPDLAVFSDAPFAPEMVVIPSGTFVMGSPEHEKDRDKNEGPQHRVVIGTRFALGRYAVTQAEWTAVMGDNPSRFVGERNPVEGVSWDDANAFISQLNARLGVSDQAGYRLPSEAEWEYACRAGTTTPFWWGDTITTDQANYDGNLTYNDGKTGVDRGKTVAVDEFAPNPWRLYQVHGNVWEWCEDCWNDTYHGAPTDGRARTTGDCAARVLRGGSWFDTPNGVRSAFRDWSSAAFRDSDVGFRLARTFPLEP